MYFKSIIHHPQNLLNIYIHSQHRFQSGYQARDVIALDYVSKRHVGDSDERYNQYKQSFIEKLIHDFDITNVHDQLFIWNKISNKYRKYDGHIGDVRVCYSNESGETDKLYRYIKKYQRYFEEYDELFSNVVTGKYIMIGFGYEE